MSDDIVKRLRTAQLYTTRDGEAADEIERLRAELAAERERAYRLASSVQKWRHERDAALAKVAKLREALLEARPYVPEHHGPIMYKIDAVLADTGGGNE